MQRPLILGPVLRPVCIVLQVLPLPGVGAIIAGAKNPHSRLLGRGVAQTALVVFGSYPLVIPGALGLIWAIWDAVKIARNSVADVPWAHPTPDADPATLAQTRQARAAQRRRARTERKAARQVERDAPDAPPRK